MSQHRRRSSAKQVKWKQKPGLIAVAAATAVVAGGVGLGLWASSGDDGSPVGAALSPSDSTSTSTSSRAADSRTPTPTPSPTRVYPLSQTPRTIPAVRSHTPARGPGWRPAKGNGSSSTTPTSSTRGG
ncbi:hypothetical protein ACQ86D_31475 [Streptomyces galilaeus]